MEYQFLDVKIKVQKIYSEHFRPINYILYELALFAAIKTRYN